MASQDAVLRKFFPDREKDYEENGSGIVSAIQFLHKEIQNLE